MAAASSLTAAWSRGADIYENATLPVSPGELDAVLVTHAHIDHSGKLPLLVRQGFTGPIYVTGATAALLKIMLLDSAHIQEFEAEWRNRKAKRDGSDPYEPLYTAEDVLAYGGAVPALQLRPDAGAARRHDRRIHRCRASAWLCQHPADGAGQRRQHTLLFSGDIGNVRRPLLRDPKTPPPPMWW